MSNTSPPSSDPVWEQGFAGHELEQQKRLARLALPEKLAWLEEAQKLADQLQQSAAKAKNTASAGK